MHTFIIGGLGNRKMEFQFSYTAFILGFILGLLYLYLKQPEKTEMVRHPTPYNAEKVTYTDATGTCFVYIAKQVNCPSDSTNIKKQPLVE